MRSLSDDLPNINREVIEEIADHARKTRTRLNWFFGILLSVSLLNMGIFGLILLAVIDIAQY